MQNLTEAKCESTCSRPHRLEDSTKEFTYASPSASRLLKHWTQEIRMSPQESHAKRKKKIESWCQPEVDLPSKKRDFQTALTS